MPLDNDPIEMALMSQLIKRKHLVTKQDYYNQWKNLGWITSRHAEDAISVDLLVKELHLESYDPILTYIPQGVFVPELPTVPKYGFVLALQTEFQQDMYHQYAHTV